MRVLKLLLLLATIALLVPATASAVTIDDFTDPAIVPVQGGTQPLVNTNAFTIQGGEQTTASGTCPTRAKTAWYQIQGNGQPITVSSTAAFDSVLAAFDKTDLGTILSCGENAADNNAQIT